jgi:pimeloyl-ACP methyl ester carboxylesterase
VTRVVAVNGARLAVELAGEGPTVVLLHAAAADRRMFAKHIPELAPRHRVISYDRRGCGESTSPPGPAAHLDDLRALLDHLRVERASLVGWSQGAGLALELARLEPERVARLVRVAPDLGPLESIACPILDIAGPDVERPEALNGLLRTFLAG